MIFSAQKYDYRIGYVSKYIHHMSLLQLDAISV